MFDNIETYRFPKVPETVRKAEKKLQSEAPALYKLISRYRNSRADRFYEVCKFHLQRSGLPYEDWIRVIADFVNV
jgi:hypothetical protein